MNESMSENDYKKLIDKSAKKLLDCMRTAGLPDISLKELLPEFLAKLLVDKSDFRVAGQFHDGDYNALAKDVADKIRGGLREYGLNETQLLDDARTAHAASASPLLLPRS